MVISALLLFLLIHLDDYDRYIFATGSEGQVYHRLLLKLFQPAPTTSHLIPSNLYTNEETFVTAAPLSANIPKMKNDTNLSYEDSLNLFSEIFKKLIDLASNNVALTHDVIKKSEAVST